MTAALSSPFISTIEDQIWERVFAYSKGIAFRNQGKLLFDVVDDDTSIGWSCKALKQTSDNIEVVVQRVDVFKGSDLTLETDPQKIGERVLEFWAQKIQNDAFVQRVKTKKVAFLLKKATHYTVFESELKEDFSGIRWSWTDEERHGLQGWKSGVCLFRWYPSQKQLFERVTVPSTAVKFALNVEPVEISKIATLLNVKPEIVDTLPSFEF